MKLSEAINQVDRSVTNTSYTDIEDFSQLFGIEANWSMPFSERVTQHYLAPWYCTDTYVGLSVYYMDNTPIAVGKQDARKSNLIIEFVSMDAAHKVRDYILTLIEPSNDQVVVVDLNKELGDHYTVTYGDQLLTKTAIYNDDPVDIVTTWNAYKDIDNWRYAEVKLPDGELVKVEMSELKIPFRLVADPTEHLDNKD